MSERTPIAKLRRQILQRKGVVIEKGTKRPIPIDNLPDDYPKTDKMKYLERKYNCKIEKIIFSKSLSEAQTWFNYEVDRATLSRWRHHIFKYLGIVEVN